MVDHEIANFENGLQEGKFTVEEAMEACFKASFCEDVIKKYTKLMGNVIKLRKEKIVTRKNRTL